MHCAALVPSSMRDVPLFGDAARIDSRERESLNGKVFLKHKESDVETMRWWNGRSVSQRSRYVMIEYSLARESSKPHMCAHVARLLSANDERVGPSTNDA